MAFRKKPEIDWEIFDDYEEEFSENKEQEPSNSQKGKDILSKKAKKVTPNYVQDEYSSSTESIEYEEKAHSYIGLKVATIAVIITLLLGLLGYFNTDFDSKGTPYIVPIQIHYERQYINKSDKLLDYLIEINTTLESDSANLPASFVKYSTILQDEKEELNSMTTSLSKYVGVPKSMDTYHTSILNFSLKTQEFIQTLIDNYNDSDYEAFRDAGLTDYINEFSEIKSIRAQINDSLFRNMESGEIE